MLPELLNFLIGVAFGCFYKRNEDFFGLLKNSAIAGLILGMVFVIVFAFAGEGIIDLGADFPGIFGIFATIILFVIIFMAGSFVGDVLESRLKK